MALTANSSPPNASTYSRKGNLPVAGNVHIWRGAALGIAPNGYIKPFEGGDRFVGFAVDEFFAGTTDGAASIRGTLSMPGLKQCEFIAFSTSVHLPVSGAVRSDIGRCVYAVDDNTFAFVGGADAKIGRMIDLETSGVAIVEMESPGVAPASDPGSLLLDVDFGKLIFAPVLTAGGEQFIGAGLRMDAIGAGITAGGVAPAVATGEVLQLLDNDNEAQNLSIETPMAFSITRGIRFTAIGRLSVAGGAATDDVDFGLFSLAGGLTDTERANTDAATAGLRSVKFHLDANANDVFATSDNDTTVVSATDTGFNNSTSANAKYELIARPSGLCELWIASSRVLSSTVFSVGSAAGVFCALLNLEKSTGTGVPACRWTRLRLAGGPA